MRPALCLHVGSHKTGTTAIQAVLDADRARLAAAGVHYPVIRPEFRGAPKAHHGPAEALLKDGPIDRLCLSRFFARVRRAPPRLTVISAEPIWRYALGQPSELSAFLSSHAAYLNRWRARLGDFDIRLMVYLRAPDALLVSLYKEAVARGRMTQPFAAYPAMMRNYFAYPERLAIYRSRFEAVDLRLFRDEAKLGLIPRFYDMMAVPPPEQVDAPLRPSVSNRATLWLARAQAEDRQRRMAHSFRVVFATDPAAKDIFADPAPSMLWPDRSAFSAFVDETSPSYTACDLDLPAPPDLPTTVWTDAEHARANAAFASWSTANRHRLRKRARHGLAFFEPDP